MIAAVACILTFRGDLSNYIDRKDFLSDLETNYLDFRESLDQMDNDGEEYGNK